MSNSHHRKMTEGLSYIMEQWVSSQPLHVIPNPVNNCDRVTLHEDALRMQFLSCAGDARPGCLELCF